LSKCISKISQLILSSLAFIEIKSSKTWMWRCGGRFFSKIRLL